MSDSITICPILDDGRTHKFWWTWVAAHPLSRRDPWYGVLEHVFGDQTINFRTSSGRWEGAYTERSEAHQTVGIFHTFSAFPTLHWVERILDECSIAYQPPVTQVRWQYHLRDCRAEADIALRIIDATGSGSEFAVVFEAKRRGGRLKPGDRDPNYYVQLTPLSEFKRKHICFIVDKSDEKRFAEALSSPHPLLTWQMIELVQLQEIQRLAIPQPAKEHLLALMRNHLGWFFERPAISNHEMDQKLFSSDDWSNLDPRIRALAHGLGIVLKAREKLSVVPPTWLGQERTVVDYRDLKEPRDWYTPVW